MRFPSLIFLLASPLLSACAGNSLSSDGARVRIVSSSPAGCEYLAEVQGRYEGGNIASGLVVNKTQAAQIDLKNQTARLGGDAVEIIRSSDQWMMGEAYRCERRTPASR